MSNRAITWAFDCDVEPGGAKFVLVALADFADESNSCYPSQDRLARMTAQSRATVGRHLASLEAQGFIARARRQTSAGYRTSDRFRLNVGGNVPMLQFEPKENDAEPMSQFERPMSQMGGVLSNNFVDPMPQIETVSLREPSVNPQSDPSRPIPADSGKREELGRFEEFWAVYPRKVGKVKARTAWKSALKGSDAEAIISGARRYAEDPNRADAFTAHPTTWLNRGSWEDEALPSRASGGPRDRQGEILQREMAAARAADAAAAPRLDSALASGPQDWRF